MAEQGPIILQPTNSHNVASPTTITVEPPSAGPVQEGSDLSVPGVKKVVLSFPARTLEVMDMLLQPNVKTYADAAKRLGVSKDAIKSRMSRALATYHRGKNVTNHWEAWRRARRDHKRGKKTQWR